MIAVVLALASAAFGGTADFVGGTLARRASAFGLVLGSQLVGVVLVGAMLLVTAHQWDGWSVFSWSTGAGLAAAVGLVAFYQALATGTMSVVAPIAALGVSVPLIAGLASGERPAVVQLLGIILALAGVVAASGPELRGDTGLKPLLLALVAAGGFGSHMVLVASASRIDVQWTVFIVKLAMVVAMCLLIGPALLRRRQGVTFDKSLLLPVIALGLLDLGALACMANAVTYGYLSVVSVLASLYPVATVLLARLVHNERLLRIQSSGVACALVGVVLIASSG